MADELTLTATVAFAKGTIRQTKTISELLIDVTGDKYVSGVQEIGYEAAEALTLGGIASPGYCVLKNLDATNYVTIRDGAEGDDLVKLLAGDVAIFRLGSATPYALADTAAVDLEYLIFET